MRCTLCDRHADEPLTLGSLASPLCPGCAWRLGRLLVESPSILEGVWPQLIEEDDGSPEPKVRLPDGQRVPLRERTEELKQQLTLEQRLQLAENYAELGLERSHLLELGFVLSREPSAALAQHALDALFAADKKLAADAVDRLRPLLLPS
jgi:hypothetical protein